MNKNQKTNVGAHDCAQRTKNIAGRMQYTPCHGITLIALIITIILILILAGVVINMATSTEGLVQKATEARDKTEQSQKTEKEIIEDLNSYIEIFESPWDGTVGTQFAGGEGTQASPYIIETAEELAYLAQQVNSGETFEGKYIKIVKAINLGNQKWTPIALGKEGNLDDFEWNTLEKSFKGHLDGNGNMIANINVEELSILGVGLIGVLEEEGTVESINIYGGRVVGKDCTGGIVGVCKGTVRNCTNKAEIIAQDDMDLGQAVGGVVGYLREKGIIENCTNNGIIEADCIVGGIVGTIDGTVVNCTNNGMIRTKRTKDEDYWTGGIVGFCKGMIENCTNNGSVESNWNTGGIVGYNVGTITKCANNGEVAIKCECGGGIVGNNKGITTDCINKGKVGGASSVGGIVGYNEGQITNCTNEENVLAESWASGGITGWIWDGTITQCTNRGNITAKEWATGGISGAQDGGTIEKCSNSGIITANYEVGGIIGYQWVGITENCINKGGVIAKYSKDIEKSGVIAGGIVGKQYEGTITNCTNQGNVVAEVQQAGGIAGVQGYKEAEAIIQECSNIGRVEAKRGIAGGIIGEQNGADVTVTNVYNSGEVVVANEANEEIRANGGIIGRQVLGTLSNAYNRGKLTGGDALGGVIGCQSLAGTVEKTYYTNSELKGIGSKTDSTTEITPVEDEAGKTEKVTEIIETFEKFLIWIATK